jgi:plastocyanin
MLVAHGLVASPPAWGAAVSASVKDDKGKPVEDAVVYIVPPSGDALSPVKPAADATMDQRDKEFVPHVLPVVVGSPVQFPNNDNIRHHVYSFSPAKKFELPLYIGTPASPVLFEKTGEVVLGCNIHDWMLGYIYILPTSHFAKTGADGKAQIRSVPAGTFEVRVWHPRLRETTEKTGQRVTLSQADRREVAFVVTLKRDWRKPRPFSSYDQQMLP